MAQNGEEAKKDMILGSKAQFYKDDYEALVKTAVVSEVHKEQERIKQEKVRQLQEKAKAEKRAEERREKCLSRWESSMSGCKVAQVLRSGILARDSSGTLVYITEMPTKNLVDGESLYNQTVIVEEPYWPSAKSDRLTAMGGVIGKEREMQYRKKELKLLRVWRIGTYSYRTIWGSRSTVSHYTASIDKAESFHKKELSATE